MDRTHLITVVSEKVLLAIIGVATCIAAGQHLYSMYLSMQIMLADLFLLFIFIAGVLIPTGIVILVICVIYLFHD